MPIIVSKPESFSKGTDHTIKISRSAIRVIPKVSSDQYFSDTDRWQSIVFNFHSVDHNEIEVVKFRADIDEPEGIFSVSNRARHSFYLGSIIIHDFDGGSLTIDNAEMPADDTSLSFSIDFPIEIPVNPTLSISAANGKINLSWEPMSLEPYYQIWKKTGTGSFVKIVDGHLINSYVDSDVVSDQNYGYYVALDYDEDLYTSNIVAIATVSPGNVSNFSITHTGPASITWNSVAGSNITYRLYRQVLGNPTKTIIYEGVGVSYTDPSVGSGNDYQYSVVAYNGMFESKVPAVSIIRPMSLSITSVEPLSSSSIEVVFNTTTGETSHVLFYKRDTDSVFNQISTSSPRTVTGLSQSTQYEFYVKATTANSSYVSDSAFKTTPYTPTIPALTASSGPASITLSWSNVSENTTELLLFKKESTSGSYSATPYQVLPSSQTQYVDTTGLVQGVNYNYVIRAKATYSFGDLSSANSNQVTASLPKWIHLGQNGGFPRATEYGSVMNMPTARGVAVAQPITGSYQYTANVSLNNGDSWGGISSPLPAARGAGEGNGRALLFAEWSPYVAISNDVANWQNSGTPWITGTLTPNVPITIRSGAYGNGTYLGVGDNPYGVNYNRFIVSTDGVNWSVIDMTGKFVFNNITYNRSYFNSLYFVNGLFYANARFYPNQNDNNNEMFGLVSSPNGLDWTMVKEFPVQAQRVAYGNGIWIAHTYYGLGGSYLRSTDLVNWTEHPYGDGSNNVPFYNAYITFVGNSFVAAAWLNTDSAHFYISSDGLTWKMQTFPRTTYWPDMITDINGYQNFSNPRTFIFGFANNTIVCLAGTWAHHTGNDQNGQVHTQYVYGFVFK